MNPKPGVIAFSSLLRPQLPHGWDSTGHRMPLLPRSVTLLEPVPIFTLWLCPPAFSAARQVQLRILPTVVSSPEYQTGWGEGWPSFPLSQLSLLGLGSTQQKPYVWSAGTLVF